MASIHDTLLSKAILKFHSELGDEDASFTELSTPEEILEQAKALPPLNASRNGSTKPIFRLQTILQHMNDFAAIVALSSGAGPHVAGVVWGSMKVILLVRLS